MSSPKFETFLALLYTDEKFRKTFYADREKSCREFGLSSKETEEMITIDKEGLELASSSYKMKREYAEFQKKQKKPWRKLLRFFGIHSIVLCLIFQTNCKKEKRIMYVKKFYGSEIYSFGNKPAYLTENPILQFGTKVYVYSESKKFPFCYNADTDTLTDILVRKEDLSETNTRKIYVTDFQGLKEKSIFIPFGSEVDLKEVKEVTMSTARQTSLEAVFLYQGKEYSSEILHFSENKKHWYWKITDRSGLNLRKKPSLYSEVIITVPYKTWGEIQETKEEPAKIQDRYGYWIKTEYNQKHGWLFSGFTYISEVEGIDDLPPEKKEIDGDDFLFKEIDYERFEEYSNLSKSDLKQRRKHSFGEIQLEYFQRKPSSYDYAEEKNYYDHFRFFLPGRRVDISGNRFRWEYWDTLYSGFIFYYSRACLNCCNPGWYGILSVTESKLFSIFLRDGNSPETVLTPFCHQTSFGNGRDIAESKITIRLNSSNRTLFILREYPICEFSSKEKKIEIKGVHIFFYIFQIDGKNIKQKKIRLEKAEIPSEWLSDWEKSKPLQNFRDTKEDDKFYYSFTK